MAGNRYDRGWMAGRGYGREYGAWRGPPGRGGRYDAGMRGGYDIAATTWSTPSGRGCRGADSHQLSTEGEVAHAQAQPGSQL